MNTQYDSAPKNSGIGDRIVGGVCGIVGGAIFAVAIMIVVYTLTNRAIWFGWSNTFIFGAVAGFVLGVVFPQVGRGIAYFVSFILPN